MQVINHLGRKYNIIKSISEKLLIMLKKHDSNIIKGYVFKNENKSGIILEFSDGRFKVI